MNISSSSGRDLKSFGRNLAGHTSITKSSRTAHRKFAHALHNSVLLATRHAIRVRLQRCGAAFSSPDASTAAWRLKRPPPILTKHPAAASQRVPFGAGPRGRTLSVAAVTGVGAFRPRGRATHSPLRHSLPSGARPRGLLAAGASPAPGEPSSAAAGAAGAAWGAAGAARGAASTSTSPRTRYKVGHGNVHRVHEPPSCELPLDRGTEHGRFQLPYVGFELYSTSDRMLAV